MHGRLLPFDLNILKYSQVYYFPLLRNLLFFRRREQLFAALELAIMGALGKQVRFQQFEHGNVGHNPFPPRYKNFFPLRNPNLPDPVQ